MRIGKSIEQRRTDAPRALRQGARAGIAVGLLVVGLAPHVEARADSAIPVGAVPDYSQHSHHELTELGARWDDLTDVERRALLREVKVRMAKQKSGADGVLMIRTQRRYGRIYRNSDGRVLRIETQVVRVQPVESAEDVPQRGFGVGFERRTAATANEVPVPIGPEAPPVPVLRINDANSP